VRSNPNLQVSCKKILGAGAREHAGGMGLGTMWGEQKARQMLADAGFDKVETKHVEGVNNYYLATRT
jgi:hypothetical protein